MSTSDPDFAFGQNARAPCETAWTVQRDFAAIAADHELSVMKEESGR
jgi:hypothetical protein